MSRKLLGISLAVGFIGLLFSLTVFALPFVRAEVTSVVDGDTIKVLIKEVPSDLEEELKVDSVVTVRYIGINAPERGTADGKIATELNYILVSGRVVYLELDDNHWDKYGRLLAYVYLDKYGQLMVNSILDVTHIVDIMLFRDTPRHSDLFSCLNSCSKEDECRSIERCYKWIEASKHVGERAWIYGVVKSVKRDSRYGVFINVGSPYPYTPRFTIFIRSALVPLFDKELGAYFEKKLMGKEVYVCGQITVYKEQPEILPTAPAQLRFESPVQCKEAGGE